MTTEIAAFRPAVDRHMTLIELIYMLDLMPRGAYLYVDDHKYRGVRYFEYPALEITSFGGTADIALVTNRQDVPVSVGEFVDFLKSVRGSELGPENKYKVDSGAYVWLPEFDAAVTGLILHGDGSVKFSIAYPE